MNDLFQPENIIALITIGMLAGILGGLLGVGGSVIIIPGLAIVFGTGHNQHLYQAAAMAVNVAVAIPAALRHRRAQALVPKVLAWMLPAAIGFIIAGVTLSNLSIFEDTTGSTWLGRLLALFLVYVIYANVRKLRIPRKDRENETVADAKITPPRCITVGGIMGTTAGLLGVGGGALAVPLQQSLIRLPLRNCIANSSAVMIFSAAIGATLKLATLGQHYKTLPSQSLPPWQTALIIAAILVPTAVIGARIGAGLTHKLPLMGVRIAFVLLMIVACLKMAAIPGLPI